MIDNQFAGLWADAAPDEQTPGIEPQAEAISIDDIDVMLARIKARMLRDPEMAPAMFKSLTILQAAESADKVPIEPMMVINWPQGLSERLKKGLSPGAMMNTANIGSIPIASDYIDKIRMLNQSGSSPIVMKARPLPSPKMTFAIDMEADFKAGFEGADALDSLMVRTRQQGKSRAIRQLAGGLGIEMVEIDTIVFDDAEYPHPTKWIQTHGAKAAITKEEKAKHKAKSRGHKHPGKGW